MEKTFKVEPFVTLLFCDKCGMEMEQEEIALLSSPIQFVYKCSKCGEKITTTKSYPMQFSKIIKQLKEGK